MTLLSSEELIAANVNPKTGLATDYLNLFNEAVMLFEMAIDMPDMVEDLSEWQRRSYVEHFQRSGFEKRDVVIMAYEQAAPDVRHRFDTACNAACDQFEQAISDIKAMDLSDPFQQSQLTEDVRGLKHLVAALDAQIHGREQAGIAATDSATQSTVDALF